MGVGAGLSMYVVVVQKFTFAISSPDEFLFCAAAAVFELYAVCCVDDGSCVSTEECNCKIGIEGGAFVGSYPPDTVIVMECQNW